MREVPMRRGLSPEGRAIRARHQSSIVFGDAPVHDARVIQNSLERDRISQESITSLVRQPIRGAPGFKSDSGTSGPSPLRATHPLPRMLAADLPTTAGGSLMGVSPGLSSSGRPALKTHDRDGSAHSDYFSLAEESLHQDDHLTDVNHADLLLKEQNQPKNLSAKYKERLDSSGPAHQCDPSQRARTSSKYSSVSTYNSGKSEILSTFDMGKHGFGATYSLGTGETNATRADLKSSQNAAMDAAANATYNISKGGRVSSPSSGPNGYSTYTAKAGGQFNMRDDMANNPQCEALESRALVHQSSDVQDNFNEKANYSKGQIGLENPCTTSNVCSVGTRDSGKFHGTGTYTIAHQGNGNSASGWPSNVQHCRDVNSSHLNGMGTSSIGQEIMQSPGSALLPNVQETYARSAAASNGVSHSMSVVDNEPVSQCGNGSRHVNANAMRSFPRNASAAHVPPTSSVRDQNFEGVLQGEQSPRSDSSGSGSKTSRNNEAKDVSATHQQLDYRENSGAPRNETNYESHGSDSLDSVRAAAAEALSVIGQSVERKMATQRQKNQELSADNPLGFGSNYDAVDHDQSDQKYLLFSPKLRPLHRGSLDGINRLKENNFEQPEVGHHTNENGRINREPISPGRHRNYAHQKDSISSIIRNIDNDLMYLSHETETPPLTRYSNALGKPSQLNPLNFSNSKSKGNSPAYHAACNSPRRWASSPSVNDANNVNGAPVQSPGNVNRAHEVLVNPGAPKSVINSASHNGDPKPNPDELRRDDTERPKSRSHVYDQNNGVVNSDMSAQKDQILEDGRNGDEGSSSSMSPSITKPEDYNESSSNITPVGHPRSRSPSSIDKESNPSSENDLVGHHKYYPSLDATYSKDSLLSRLQGGTSTGLMPAIIHRPSDFTRSLRNNSMHSQSSTRRKPMKASDISPTLADGGAVDSASVVSRELRQTKVSDVIAKIKEKKPTCDMNYLTVKHSIERQHKTVFSHIKAKEHENSAASNLPSARSVSTSRDVRSRSVDSSRRFSDPSKSKGSQVLGTYSSQTNLNDRRMGSENWRSRGPVKSINGGRNRQMDLKKPSTAEQGNPQRHRQQLPNRQAQQHQVPPLALQGITRTTLDESGGKNKRDSLVSIDMNSVDHSSHAGSIKLPLNVRSNSLASSDVAAPDEEDMGDSQNHLPVRRKGSVGSGGTVASPHGHRPVDHRLAQITEVSSGSGSESSSGPSSRPEGPPADPEEGYVTSTPRGDLDQQQFDPRSASVHPKAQPSTSMPPSRTSQRAGRRPAKEKPNPKVRSKSGDPPPSYKRGQVPRYLRARRAEEARAEAEAEARDPECPERHTRLPEHERLSTLRLLRHSEKEVLQELSALPLAQDTLRVRALRAQLEDKLQQLENGIKIFSQPKVFVLNDD